MIAKLKSEFRFKSFTFEIDEIEDDTITEYLNETSDEGWALYSTNLALEGGQVVKTLVHKKRKKDKDQKAETAPSY
jgi:hypothetical protein